MPRKDPSAIVLFWLQRTTVSPQIVPARVVQPPGVDGAEVAAGDAEQAVAVIVERCACCEASFAEIVEIELPLGPFRRTLNAEELIGVELAINLCAKDAVRF